MENFQAGKVAVSNFLSQVETECKSRDSRVFRLRGVPATRENGPIYIEVGVKLREGAEVKLPLAVSYSRVLEGDVPTIVSSILMTVDRYSWGLT